MSLCAEGKPVQLYQLGLWRNRGRSAWGSRGAFSKGVLYKEMVGVDPSGLVQFSFEPNTYRDGWSSELCLREHPAIRE